MERSSAEIVREYGSFPGVENVAGVSYDGTNIWIAAGDTMKALDPERGTTVRSLDVPAHAGTAFDGKYLFQIAGNRIQKVDPQSGSVVSSIPTPGDGAAGLAWAEGSFGSDSTAIARSMRSIRQAEKYCAPSIRPGS